MILIFENNGNVYKLESRQDEVRIYIARNYNALELMRVGTLSSIEWQIEYRS